jgi:hypothetical protein
MPTATRHRDGVASSSVSQHSRKDRLLRQRQENHPAGPRRAFPSTNVTQYSSKCLLDATPSTSANAITDTMTTTTLRTVADAKKPELSHRPTQSSATVNEITTGRRKKKNPFLRDGSVSSVASIKSANLTRQEFESLPPAIQRKVSDDNPPLPFFYSLPLTSNTRLAVLAFVCILPIYSPSSGFVHSS